MVTTIKVQENTRVRLNKYGLFGQSMDEVINSILDKLERK